MVDLDALQAAGIADAHQRAALIAYLDSLGFTAEEMVEAERRGRLFGLAGDVLQWSGPPTYSLRTAAERLGVPVEDVTKAWAAVGLSVSDPGAVALSQTDVDGLACWVEVKAVMGDEPALAFLRVMGNAMARLAEAGSTMVRLAQPDILMGHSGDEYRTARTYRAIAESTSRFSTLIDVVWRQHLNSARVHFEGGLTDASASVTCGIGFADLTGFTALTQRLSPDELSDLLLEFGGVIADLVHADGGRVVKFIGDEVMWVTSTPELLAKVAVDLVEHPRARDAGLQVRAGLGYGRVLAIGGDYFGTAVNLAARLVGAASPGQILAGPDVYGQLPDWPAAALEPLSLKGFDAAVAAYDLHAAR
ncbi:adenylate/guanylate cyclase domain-containing protein [Mycobacterium sp. IDR2000157661]|uniref:adenylate/guanylate cyclase domain-containing protein n=1 Tax=Mycobacterium sp. IDR2000157661 TaxID=2867005 RepID=UPI00272E7551|nr:adenylate/guanylate cyclase domain-containing protein [Mycobacterium sp. IDR2000157661]ULE32075.1 adenylate/guanylate cyclase domain-containing protein [Mycobacterium sp. IDR2000157661]